MSIAFSCPSCRESYSVPDETAGRTTTCKKCRGAVTVPSSAPPVAQIAPPAPDLRDLEDELHDTNKLLRGILNEAGEHTYRLRTVGMRLLWLQIMLFILLCIAGLWTWAAIEQERARAEAVRRLKSDFPAFGP